MEKKLALFDFDGTLTRGDSLWLFLRYTVPPFRLARGLALLVFRFSALFLRGRWSNEAAKAMLLSEFYKNQLQEDLQEIAERFAKNVLMKQLRPKTMQVLESKKATGWRVVLVSASPDLWLLPISQLWQVELICTELEYIDGRFSGRFSTPNCNGAEKARRIKTYLDLSVYSEVYACGNTGGDQEMLALATEAVWIS